MKPNNLPWSKQPARRSTAGLLSTACALRLLPLLLLALPAVVKAQDYTYTNNNGTITIMRYTGPGGEVAIPATIDDLPVTAIGRGAFYNIYSLTSLTIPSSVTSIGRSAFYDCGNLTNVTIGSNVTIIESEAFHRSGLTSITIPNSVKGIGREAFHGCRHLTSVTIPDSVTGIGTDAFSSCHSLASVTIGSGVTGISDFTFSGCTSLTSVMIGNSVTFIGKNAFWDCTSLTSVTIPSSATSIALFEFYAFDGCTSLTAINVSADNPAYSSVDGVLLNKNRTELIRCPQGKSGNYTIHSGTTEIWPDAFSGCTSLTSVTIPSSVTYIDDNTFSGSTSLTSVTIPNSVTYIEGSAFAYCTSLNGVYFEGNAPNVDSSAFVGAAATIYYLPGTTGWGPTFGGRPTALWKPLVQASDASFGVRANQFGFNINWASGRVVVVEACTDLAQPLWSPVGTNSLIDGSSYFSDPQWTNHPSRFYRLRSL